MIDYIWVSGKRKAVVDSYGSWTHSFPISAIFLIFRKIQYKSRESKILKILMNKIFEKNPKTLGLPEYFLNTNSKFL